MKQKTKMSGLVWHVKPTGKAYESKRNQCEQKLRKLEKLLEKGYSLTHAEKPAEKQQPKAIITAVFGEEIKVSIEVFKKRYEPYGFKIIAEV